MRKIEGKKVLQIYTSDELDKQFSDNVKAGDKSDIIRGMILLYLQNGNFKKQVDTYVATHKTL